MLHSALNFNSAPLVQLLPVHILAQKKGKQNTIDMFVILLLDLL